jgi:hypothetical protein
VVFRRYRPPPRLRKRVHPLVSLALLQSSSCLRRPGLDTGRLPWGLEPLRDISPASPLNSEHPRPAYVPPSAFHTLSTACSSHCLADLFHPAATSRFPASGASSPDLTVPTSSMGLASAPLAPSPAAGFPTTPESVASTSRPSPGRDPQHRQECYPPWMPVSPRALLLLRARFTSLECAIDALSARGLGCPVLTVPRPTNPQRVNRLVTSMLYP